MFRPHGLLDHLLLSLLIRCLRRFQSRSQQRREVDVNGEEPQAGYLTLRIENSSMNRQVLRLDHVRPDVFSLRETELVLAPGERCATLVALAHCLQICRKELGVEFHPPDANTVYIGVAVFTHAFGTLSVPLKGVGAAAKLIVTSLSLPAPCVSIPEEKAAVDSTEAKEGKQENKQVVVQFPSVKLHQVANASFELHNAGLLPAEFELHCPSVSFRLIDGDGHEASQLSGVVASGERLVINCSCLLFAKRRDGVHSGLPASLCCAF